MTNFHHSCLNKLQNHDGKLFLCPQQRQAKTKPTFETTMFQTKFTFWHIKLNICMQEINFFFFINHICLVVSSLEIQRRLIQIKVHYKFFHSVSNEPTCKPSNVAAVKNFSCSVHVIDITCFYERFLFHQITGSHFFCKGLSLLKRLFQTPYCSFL